MIGDGRPFSKEKQMLRRYDIRYHALWVRLVCCFSVAIGISNAVHFQLLTRLDGILRTLIIDTDVGQYAHLPASMEIVVVFCVCLAPAVPRFERPFTMFVCGTGFLMGYLALVLGIASVVGAAPPISAPLLGLLGSTAVLETMAWSEERANRHRLEDLERARQRFTDMLVHDLKKKMSSILMSLTVLERGSDRPNTDPASVMATMRASAERMLILINNLLGIRKIEESGLALQRERVALRTLVQDCLDEHAPAIGLLDVRVRLAGHRNPVVRADPDILSRVFTNLLWNALQHAPQGSEIEVRCGYTADNAVQVYVANRGTPIPPDCHNNIFQPFVSEPNGLQTRHVDGTGIGLAFCKLAMEAHGGAIGVESPWQRHGDGVRVLVELPAHSVVHPRTTA